jgi:transposase
MKRKKLSCADPQGAQQLADAARRENNGRVRSRMLAVRHLLTGHGTDETAGLFLIGRSQLYYWLHRYRAEGLAGLRDRPRPGAPTHLKAEDENAFRLLIKAGPPPHTGNAMYRVQEIRRLLRDRFDAYYSLSGVYVLLQRLGLTHVGPDAQPPSTH